MKKRWFIAESVLFRKKGVLMKLKDYTLEQLYNSLKELGIIDKLREFIKEGKKVFSDKCCEYVSQKMCKKYCQKIFGLIQE